MYARAPGIILNGSLLEDDRHLIDKNNEHSKCCDFSWAGRVLKQGLEQDRDYAIVTENLFTILNNTYDCDYPIYRYTVKNMDYHPISNPKRYFVQIYLPTIKIMDVPKLKGVTEFEYMQIPDSNHRVGDVVKRIKECRDSEGEDEIRIWKLKYDNQKFIDYYNIFKEQFTRHKVVKVQGEQISYAYKATDLFEFTDQECIVIEYMIGKYDKFCFELDDSVEEGKYAYEETMLSHQRRYEHNTVDYEVPIERYGNGETLTGLVGLENLGSTCYMNSALQWLLNCTDLIHYIQTNHEEIMLNLNKQNSYLNRLRGWENLLFSQKYTRKNEVTLQFIDLILQVSNRRTPFRPDRICEAICGWFEQFSPVRQCDSYELLIILLDQLDIDINDLKTKHNVNIPNIVHEFKGKTKSEIIWQTCKHVSAVSEDFTSLSLSIKPKIDDKIHFTIFFRPFDPWNDAEYYNIEIEWSEKTKISKVIQYIQDRFANKYELVWVNEYGATTM